LITPKISEGNKKRKKKKGKRKPEKRRDQAIAFHGPPEPLWVPQ